jgi:spermidine/putrescine-binding protein
MKKIMLLLAILSLTAGAKAQNAKVDATGNYTAVSKAVEADSAKTTGKTFTDHKGVKFDVKISPKGKMFYVRTSKAGNSYKVYLKF